MIAANAGRCIDTMLRDTRLPERPTRDFLMTNTPPDPAIAFAGLILDLDGTLADTMPSHYIAWCRALAPYGLTYPEDLFYQWGGKPDTRIVEDLAADQGATVDAEEIAEAKRQAYLDLGPAHVRALPRTLALAEACLGVIPMAIATGGRRNVASSILDTLKLRDWFEAVITADDVTEHKPAAETYAKAAEAIRVPADRCLAVEDTEIGMAAARAAGCTVLHVEALPDTPTELLAADLRQG